MAETLVISMFVVTFACLLAGFPVAFTLSGAALLFALFSYAFGAFDISFVRAMPQRIFGTAMWNEVLLAVPLFIFMGVMLERSKVAEEMLESMGRLFGRLRGGLGISVLVVGMLLAASTGIVGATVVTMGLISLPTMLRRGYDPKLASGMICASGTLGQIIPPSIVLVILGEQISNAYVDAQREIGNWSPDPVSVGDLFAGALIPGLVLVGLYMLYQIMTAWLRPETSPAIDPAEFEHEQGFTVWRSIGHALIPPVVLIVAVLGSILIGIATPTEAASVGAVGAILLAGLRLDERRGIPIYAAGLSLIGMLVLSGLFDLRVSRDEIGSADQAAIYGAYVLAAILAWGTIISLLRIYRSGILHEVGRSTMQISAMIFVILIGAALFSLVFRGLGGDDMVHALLSDVPGGVIGAMLIVMLIMFLLGFFLDFIEITFVVVPIIAPVLLQMDINPIWLGVMMAVNLQTSFLTPPFGFALFYLRGVAPPEVTTGHIYRGVVPFVIIQLVGLAIIGLFPGLVTWLPKIVFG
ncbi:MAG: TRAP transporter large permease subunit [Rhodospirillaceae bacterium]|nr:TRAP transporter large permease subunit [Rhodospirillaceae bacterium]MBT7292961.1 TRAP transporter large permease subunit [Rhodospirillaceae bacterium]